MLLATEGVAIVKSSGEAVAVYGSNRVLILGGLQRI